MRSTPLKDAVVVRLALLGHRFLLRRTPIQQIVRRGQHGAYGADRGPRKKALKLVFAARQTLLEQLTQRWVRWVWKKQQANMSVLSCSILAKPFNS